MWQSDHTGNGHTERADTRKLLQDGKRQTEPADSGTDYLRSTGCRNCRLREEENTESRSFRRGPRSPTGRRSKRGRRTGEGRYRSNGRYYEELQRSGYSESSLSPWASEVGDARRYPFFSIKRGIALHYANDHLAFPIFALTASSLVTARPMIGWT